MPNLRFDLVSFSMVHFQKLGRHMATRWYDDDKFWKAVAPVLFSDERCGEAAGKEVEQVLALLGAPAGAHLLDLCCGPGRHAVELARRGFSVTGVDRTAAYLEQARRQTDQEGLSIEFVRADMLDFCRSSTFDGALNLFTSFGFFESDEDELQVLSNVFESLKPNGRFIIDILGKEVLSRKFQTRSWQSTADGKVFLLEERKIRSGWGSIDNRWLVFNEAGRHEFHWAIRVYSGRELETLLRRAGFSEIVQYGGLDGAPYDDEATRLVAVAQK
jgi:SAM-dependent methyltransferase